MSTANHPTETYDCEVCEDPLPAHATVAGSFCSTTCLARHQGQKLLNKLESDHRFCYTCFSRLKTIDEPTDDWKHEKTSRVKSALDQGGTFIAGDNGQLVLNATQCEYSKTIDIQQVIGFQYGTEHATTGVVEDKVDDYIVIERRGLICRCGNIHHANREAAIQHSDIRTVARNFIHSLYLLHEGVVHDKHIDASRLVAELKDQVGAEDWDFALAVGHAIQGDG